MSRSDPPAFLTAWSEARESIRESFSSGELPEFLWLTDETAWLLYQPSDPDEVAASVASEQDVPVAILVEPRPAKSYEQWHAETVALLAEQERRRE